MKIGVLLSGCGVYDGSEIQEAVLTLLAIEELGYETVCISIDSEQHHVINHLTGEDMNEKRNMLIESARIARGDIKNILDIDPADIDALVIPGGFGNAKNLTTWAFNGANAEILPIVKLFLVNLINIGRPIVALCVSPIVLAKAVENSNIHLNLTLGSSKAPSPYNITEFNMEIEKTGNSITEKTITEIQIDVKNKIISAPCYMMDATILEIRNNIKEAISHIKTLI